MSEVTLKKLSCQQTADISVDNCRIEAYLDNSNRREPYSLRRQMTAGGPEWTVNRTYWFNNTIRIELHVEDWLFPDDWLGSGQTVDLQAGAKLGTIQLPGGGSASGTDSVSFQREGADYELTYSVTQSSGTLKPVDRALSAFPTSSGVGEWAWVDAQPLKNRVETIVAFARGQTSPGATGATIATGPFQVDQDGTPFCGPSGIVFSLAARDPRRFVEMVRSLYEQGEFLGRERVGLVSRGLRHSSVPARVQQNDLWADWVMLASIRESAHWFNVANNALLGTLSIFHMNLPWTMAHWARDVLGHVNATWLSASDLFTAVHDILGIGHSEPVQKNDGVAVLREAMQDHNNGGFATLLVSADFPNRVNFWKANFPFQAFHWVALGGNVTISSSDVELEYHDSRHGQKLTRTFSHQEFNDLVWGGVSGVI